MRNKSEAEPGADKPKTWTVTAARYVREETTFTVEANDEVELSSKVSDILDLDDCDWVPDYGDCPEPEVSDWEEDAH